MSDENLPAERSPEGQFLLYQTEDGQTRIECRFAGETIWLSQANMAELYQTTKQNVSLHLNNLYEEGELVANRVVKEYLTTGPDGKNYRVNHYNLDAILAVGYRVRSHRGTQFRIWATERLREYLVKGFAMDDARLKLAGGGQYFEELLARIRDIRSSERIFWRKVLDIYATSIDYDPATEASTLFFKTVQNKMHCAAHGHTAAEIVHKRTDASRPNMGLASWSGNKLRKGDVSIAKNYLNQEEIEALNRMVTAYLEFAELQALNRKAVRPLLGHVQTPQGGAGTECGEETRADIAGSTGSCGVPAKAWGYQAPRAGLVCLKSDYGVCFGKRRFLGPRFRWVTILARPRTTLSVGCPDGQIPSRHPHVPHQNCGVLAAGDDHPARRREREAVNPLVVAT